MVTTEYIYIERNNIHKTTTKKKEPKIQNLNIPSGPELKKIIQLYCTLQLLEMT